MSRVRPIVLTIGGFDPSAGAGVLADLKTFEQHKVYGLAVNTANTVQTEDKFFEFNYLSEDLILQQLKPLIEQYKIEWVKIGLIENWSTILRIRELLSPKTKIIWDPILSISSGPEFKGQMEIIDEVLESVDYITPNWEEAEKITSSTGVKAGNTLAEKTVVYLKGGHNEADLGKDMIFEKGEHLFNLNNYSKAATAKHGSGCTLAAALTANLANGYKLKRASLNAKKYVTALLESNKTLLGYHKK
ncbi:MAG: bifunctional hydroxymethylpyrimidine kinase/phosphomethylpyrimidine kinase [Crocinitomicaceae bacterium]|nr:bifunctional hydroxymethylpyrimidine kinase/phosphomethylpyrimidine kinase [Crocinitomicaceae bacterium]